MTNKDFDEWISKLGIPKLEVSKIPLVVSVVMLLMEIIAHRPPGFQTLMKFVVCGTAGYLAYLTKGTKKNEYWMWGFIAVAIIFNPIAPVYIDHDMRLALYWAVALLFSAIFYVRHLSKGQ